MYGLCLNSMTYHIIQVGNFFGSFSFTCLFHLVVDLETLTLWCSFSAPLQLQLGSCIFCILWQALPVFTVPLLPPLILRVLHHFTNRPVLTLFFFTSSNNLPMLEITEEPSQKLFILSSKKIHERLPPFCFLSLSSLSSCTVSWLSHDLLLRMSLTLAKESGISAFCRGLP